MLSFYDGMSQPWQSAIGTLLDLVGTFCYNLLSFSAKKSIILGQIRALVHRNGESTWRTMGN